MNTIQNNKVVTITYAILNSQQAVVEQQDMPVSYLHGGQLSLLPSIENALVGHQVGDRVEIVLAPEEALGLRDENLVLVDDIHNIPPEYRFVGAKVEFYNDRGETKAFYVTNIENGKLTMDGNPPLAGQSVTWIVNVMDIRDATPGEIRQGIPDTASVLH
mgnify:CR=1 FL=1